MGDTRSRVILLGFVIVAFILLLGLLAILGFFSIGLMPGRSNPASTVSEVSVSP